MPIIRSGYAPTGNTTQRGYGSQHQRRRAALAPRVTLGLGHCARCGKRILPGQPWDLDHSDDRKTYLGPSHQRCNRSHG